MSWVTYFAIYFIVWWITLFAVLPFGLKTQDENEDVTLGTVSSAPRGRMSCGRCCARRFVSC
jgi:predicted secreted protein